MRSGRPIESITGKIFGKLLVIRYVGKINNKYLWECKCECKNITIVTRRHLSEGNTKSCGCLRKDKKIGNNNPNWRGGKSNQNYPPEWNNFLRASIRNRDNHKCQFSGCNYDDTKNKRKLHIHHIDGN